MFNELVEDTGYNDNWRWNEIPLKRIENKQNKVMIGSMKVAALGEILLSG